MKSLIGKLALPATLALLGGCAQSGIVVAIDTAAVAPRKADATSRAKVEVSDIRKEVHIERTTIGGLSMGTVTVTPPVPALVRSLIAARADAVFEQQRVSATETVLCGIRVFDITTPATVLYWDVDAHVELVLRMRGQDRTVTGRATERTYLYPSETLVTQVTTRALGQLGADAERALTELVALPR